jgi:hypothetical protein
LSITATLPAKRTCGGGKMRPAAAKIQGWQLRVTSVEAPKDFELRDPVEARRFLLQGLWWQRVTPLTPASVRPALALSLEITAGGQPLPPPGFVADVATVAISVEADGRATSALRSLPGVPANLLRTYEDHVLGKLYADWTFERAAHALRGYEGRDRVRGIAFLLARFRERAGFHGVELAPGIIKALIDLPPEKVLAEGWELFSRDGPQPLLLELYGSLPGAVRRLSEVLGSEDIFELEHRTALAEPGERLALRQVLQAATLIEAGLPRHALRPTSRQAEVPTRVLEEDTYPVGGFSSLSTRGSVESLLYSQLAYMEPAGERPDLFDIKFVRDELLYYARDENQFHRRRRTFVFALAPDLVATRFKDPELPFQRGVLLLALIFTAIRRLTVLLSSEALLFEIIFIGDGKKELLAAERALLETLLRESIANGTTRVLRLLEGVLAAHCTEHTRRSLCECLVIGTDPQALHAADVRRTRLRIDGPRPAVGQDDKDELSEPQTEDAVAAWGAALENLLRSWI